MLFEGEPHPKLGEALGWHWLIDLYKCSNIPTDPVALEVIMVSAARNAGATVVQSCFHKFSPFGLSGVVVIAESHFAVHTWPEHNAMCLDLFSCSDKIKPQVAIDFISHEVRAGEVDQRNVSRGKRI